MRQYLWLPIPRPDKGGLVGTVLEKIGNPASGNNRLDNIDNDYATKIKETMKNDVLRIAT